MDFLSMPILTQSDSQLPIHLTTVGHWDYQLRLRRPEGFPDYQWLQCSSGTGELIIGDQRHLVKPGQGFLLFPHEPHAYRPLTEPWDLHWISFNGSITTSLLNQAGVTKSGVYTTTDSEILTAHIIHIYKMAITGHPFVGMECSKLVYAFLLDLVRSVLTNTTSTTQNYMKLHPVIQFTEANSHRPLTLAEMASCIGVSAQHLCQLFRDTLKMRPMEFVNRERINKSKELIFREPYLKLHEIASRVGFDNPSYFSSVFKKVEGMRPEQFKNFHGMREK